MTFYQYLIALGSNMNDRRSALDTAIEKLRRFGVIKAVSKYYETEPVGAADQLFLNAACLLHAAVSPEAMMANMLEIETSMGRIRLVKWGNRMIDLDIIMAKNPDGDDISIDTPHLRLPHPHALERDFVILPAADVCPHWTCPGSTLDFAALRATFA